MDTTSSRGPERQPVFDVLNPCGVRRAVAETPLAERLESLEGKVVYCISQFVGGADVFLKKIADALPAWAPGARAVFVKKATTYMSDDPELWAEIEREGDAVIYGCGA
jgi:hypothetical protein